MEIIIKKDIHIIEINLSLEEKKKLTTNELFELQQKYKPNKKELCTLYYNNYLNLYNEHFGYTLINKENLQEMINFIGNDKCLEIGAGLGFISSLLKSQSINITVTSIVDGSYYNEINMKNNIWCDIELIDCVKAVQKYHDYNCLFISWGTQISEEALNKFYGNKLILINKYGYYEDILFEDDEQNNKYCFWRTFNKNECKFKLIKRMDKPHFKNRTDYIFFYERQFQNILLNKYYI